MGEIRDLMFESTICVGVSHFKNRQRHQQSIEREHGKSDKQIKGTEKKWGNFKTQKCNEDQMKSR